MIKAGDPVELFTGEKGAVESIEPGLIVIRTGGVITIRSAHPPEHVFRPYPDKIVRTCEWREAWPEFDEVEHGDPDAHPDWLHRPIPFLIYRLTGSTGPWTIWSPAEDDWGDGFIVCARDSLAKMKPGTTYEIDYVTRSLAWFEHLPTEGV